ncbi:MAG: hypothetical protein RBR06_02145 [Desulfuromonadaceae bacterium]|nr:hypothetical protein [Desulfuromonadaceae bacterium]
MHQVRARNKQPALTEHIELDCHVIEVDLLDRGRHFHFMDLPGVAVLYQDIDLDENAIVLERGFVYNFGARFDQLPGLLNLFRNRQPIKGDFGTAGEELLGENADFMTGTEPGFKIRLWRKFKVWRVLLEIKRFRALHAL